MVFPFAQYPHTDYCTNTFLTLHFTHTLTHTHTLSNEMECSPHSRTPPSLSPTPIPSPIAKIPLKEIAQCLADSLHPEELFPGTDYLRNVKAELRKLMKQR